jgi:hypothetical protein
MIATGRIKIPTSRIKPFLDEGERQAAIIVLGSSVLFIRDE